MPALQLGSCQSPLSGTCNYRSQCPLDPKLNGWADTRVVEIAEGHDLVAFVQAAAQIVDGIFASGDESQHLKACLHNKIIIGMDSDDERNNQMETYQQFLLEANKSTPVAPTCKLDIIVGIYARESKGSGLKKHTVYLIKGEDKNGSFEVWRRFNEFHEMRAAMVKAWPGCLIPSLPSKNPLNKNEEQISRKRERYLNDFLKKMAMRSFLYYSDEFQALLRSPQSNLSDTFSKWPTPSTEGIINRYKQNFAILAGRQINNSTVEEIFAFHRCLEDNQKTLIEYRKTTKEMAFQRDRLNKYYLQFFKTARIYEESILTTYAQPQDLVYANSQYKQCREHEEQMQKILQANPYWLLYDLIKNEERDGRAFVELIKSIEHYAEKTKEVESKIENNVKGISGAATGKVTIKTIGMKGTAEEIKYQLQVQNQTLKKEKEYSQTLRDIIVALVCYIQIRQYKVSKKIFYEYTIRKLANHEDEFVKAATKVWEQLQVALEQLAEKTI